MKHFDFAMTPLHQLNHFSKKWNIDILCKRDDLFTKAGGGSKARMLQYILHPLFVDKIKVLITAGGPCSNYNRAAALACAELGIKMKLISYTDNPSEYSSSLNHYIANLAGVDFTFCDKVNVPSTIQDAIEKAKEAGCNYRYLYGGGKSLEGVYAYYDAVKELRKQYSGELSAIFVACGTGTTLTGICAGAQEYFPKTEVHAISIARDYQTEIKVLKENLANINIYLNTKYDFSNLFFHDEFLLGGYGRSTPEELEVIKECISNQGMLIDPTYSGKAFYGMSEIIKQIKFKKSPILFWNTGGNMNLFSQKEIFKC